MTSREKVQALIRAEIDRQRPVDVARRTLELLAASSVRAIEAPPGYEIVGRDGAPRTHGDGAEPRPFTLADLFSELRAQHPSLFLPPSAPAAAPEPAAAPDPRLPPAVSRDWIRLSDGSEGAPDQADSPAAASGPAAASPSPATVRAGAGRSAGLVAGRLAGHLAGLLGGRLAEVRRVLHRPTRVPAAPAAAPTPATVPGDGLKPAITRPRVRLRRPRSLRPVYAALGLVLLVGGGAWLLSGGEDKAPQRTEAAPAAAAKRTTTEAKNAANPRREPVETGTLVPSEAAAKAAPTSLAGVAEVVDTATLRLGGRTVRLFGVETAKGAQPTDLSTYLAGRPVACQPSTAGAGYLCNVDGHDLSEVVLYNGGGRATSDATSDLVEAERHARTEKLGVWRK
ncbi:thermonuclease family protein [Methylobacterium sp. JK268]